MICIIDSCQSQARTAQNSTQQRHPQHQHAHERAERSHCVSTAERSQTHPLSCLSCLAKP
eukprot:3845168-Amphidinium_carterae.1